MKKTYRELSHAIIELMDSEFRHLGLGEMLAGIDIARASLIGLSSEVAREKHDQESLNKISQLQSTRTH